jgi:hypothetical protein
LDQSERKPNQPDRGLEEKRPDQPEKQPEEKKPGDPEKKPEENKPDEKKSDEPEKKPEEKQRHQPENKPQDGRPGESEKRPYDPNQYFRRRFGRPGELPRPLEPPAPIEPARPIAPPGGPPPPAGAPGLNHQSKPANRGGFLLSFTLRGVAIAGAVLGVAAVIAGFLLGLFLFPNPKGRTMDDSEILLSDAAYQDQGDFQERPAQRPGVFGAPRPGLKSLQGVDTYGIPLVAGSDRFRLV